jgi:3-oxoacyl-[acyl-carrier protein] reductase
VPGAEGAGLTGATGGFAGANPLPKDPALAGRRVLVTDGAHAIGRAIVAACAREGAAVAFAGAGGIRADAADPDDVARFFAEARTALGGPPDVLVHVAEARHDAALADTDVVAWDRVIDANLTAAYRCAKAALRGMIAARFGRIVLVVSPAAFLGRADGAAYAASHGGLVALAKSLAREVARFGITVNAVAPGPLGGEPERPVPLGRVATPDELASAVVYLASPAAGYVTGTTVHVDGGLTML